MNATESKANAKSVSETLLQLEKSLRHFDHDTRDAREILHQELRNGSGAVWARIRAIMESYCDSHEELERAVRHRALIETAWSALNHDN